jgi:hypothetical protein
MALLEPPSLSAWDEVFHWDSISIYSPNDLIYNRAILHSCFLSKYYYKKNSQYFLFIVGEVKYNFEFSAEFCDHGNIEY